MTAPIPSLALLPPELLSRIFLTSSLSTPSPSCPSYDESLRLVPSQIPISRALVPFTRANAYASIVLRGPRAVERLARTLQGREGLGALIRRVELREGKGGMWSAEELRRMFDCLDGVEQVELNLEEEGLLVVMSEVVLTSPAFASSSAGVKLILAPVDEALSFATLAHLSATKGVKEVEIRGKMRLKSEGLSEGIFAERGGTAQGSAAVERLVIEAEPHADGFTPLLAALPCLKSLTLKSGTTDVAQIFAASVIPEPVREGLEDIEFSSAGYLSRELGTAFAACPSLRRLSLRSSALVLTPEFLLSLASLPLEILQLCGPLAHGGRADETLELLADWLESLTITGGCEALGRVELDLPSQPLKRVRGWCTAAGGSEGRCAMGNLATQLCRLALVAEKKGIELGGSVSELLPLPEKTEE